MYSTTRSGIKRVGGRSMNSRSLAILLVVLALAGCDSGPFASIWQLLFQGDVETTKANFELRYASAIQDATIEHGVVAVFAEVTGGDGAKVAFFNHIPLAFSCIDEGGQYRSRSSKVSRIPALDEYDQSPPDRTSSSVMKLWASSYDWRDAPGSSDSATAGVEWADDCPESAPTVRVIVETAPQAVMEAGAQCGDSEFGDASRLESAYKGTGASGTINLDKRGEPLFRSSQTWTLATVCQSRDPLADDVEPETAILDLSEQGIVPVTLQ